MFRITHAQGVGGRTIEKSNLARFASRRRNLLALAVGGVSALVVTQSARAASGTWNGAADGTWNGANWSTSPPPTTGDTATFANAGNGNTNITIDSSRVVKSIVFDPTAGTLGNYTIGSLGANAGNTLSLNSAGNISIGAATGVTGLTETFNAPLSLGGSYTFSNLQTGAGSSLVLAGNITNSATSTLTLSGNGTGTGNLISGNISDGAGSTVQSVTFSASAGKWTFSGTNSYSGTTLFSGTGSLVLSGINTSLTGQTTTSSGSGILLLNNATDGGLAGGTFNLNGGGIQSGVANLILSNNFIQQGTPAFGGSNSITITGTLTNSGSNRTLTSSITAGSLTLAGNIYLSEASGTGRTWAINGSGNTLISGIIENFNGAPGTAGGLTLTSSGITTLSNPNNSYTGATTIGSASAPSFVIVNTLGSGGSDSNIGASSNAFSNLVLINASTLQYTGPTVSTDRAFSLGVNTAAIIDVANPATNLTIAGDTGGVLASQSFTKAGPGTLTLTAAQTNTGATTAKGGTLLIDMNAGSSLASSSAPTLAGGTLQFKGANNAASTQTLGNLTLTADTNGIIKLTPTGNGSVALTLGNTWNRALASGSTLNIDLSAGNVTLSSQPLTSSGTQTSTSGIENYATVTDGSGTGFATIVNNNVVRYTAAATLLANSDGSSSNFVTKVGDAAYSGNTLTMTSALHRMASLQINTDGGTGALDLDGNTAGNSLATTFLVTGTNSSNNFTIQDGSIGSNATGGRETIFHQFAAGTLTVSATIGFNTNTTDVVKDGPGVLSLTGPNPYTSTTVINGGVLRAADGTGLPTVSLLTMNNGVFETGAATFTRTLGSASGDVQITGGTSGFSAFGGPVAISIGGTGTETPLTWGSANFNPGTLVLNESTANNTLGFNNAIDLNGATRTINVNAASANTATISGVLSSSGVGGGLVKGGTGTLKLTNADTYKGMTTISAGTLALSTSSSTNNIGNSSAIVVGSGATLDVTGVTSGFALNGATAQVLGGTGTVSGNVSVSGGAILSAGTSIALGTGPANANGTLTTGNLSWGAAGKYSVKITDATGTLGAGTGWDSVSAAALSVTGTSSASLSTAFNIDPVGTLTSVAGGTSWAIATTTSRALVNGNTDDGASTTTAPNLLTDGSNAFALDTSNFSVNGVSGSSLLGSLKLELVQTGSTDTLDLTYSSTPEPGTAMLVFGGVVPMLMKRRRRATGRSV